MKDLMKTEPEARYVTHKFPIPQSVKRGKKRKDRDRKKEAPRQAPIQRQMQHPSMQSQAQQPQQLSSSSSASRQHTPLQEHHAENRSTSSSRNPWDNIGQFFHERITAPREAKKRSRPYGQEEIDGNELEDVEDGQIHEKVVEGQPDFKNGLHRNL
eukprot:TRINITY_DN15609_c0_g1_i1.p1 TRINITY_DN15609_c0_g1~~TRINITY_DN15609_c0_g1_i1.p1  ORF type:complete len:172 (+),score=32.96 TRINITY_DN15609_c0_g1_i1:50-517(+)